MKYKIDLKNKILLNIEDVISIPNYSFLKAFSNIFAIIFLNNNYLEIIYFF